MTSLEVHDEMTQAELLGHLRRAQQVLEIHRLAFETIG